MRCLCRVVLALLFVAVAPRAGLAQTCIGPVEGVPGQANLPPHWWDNLAEPGAGTPQPVYHTTLTDPRWVRAGAVSYDSGAGEDALFRVSHNASDIYLSWWIKSTPAGTAAQNVLYFGYEEPGGVIRIVRLQLPNLTGSQGDPPDPTIPPVPGTPNVNFMRRNPATGQAFPFNAALDTPPAWLTQTARHWINAPQNTWAMQVRMPKSAVLMTAGLFKFWFQAYTGTLTMPVIRYTWPRGPGSSVTEGGFPTDAIFPDPATTTPVPVVIGNWDLLRPSTGPLDGICASQGVSIDYDTIGTMNTPAYQVFFAAVPPAASHPVNRFFARPRNFSGMDIPASGIKATFRIANWGSMPNWEDGVPIDQLWSKIQCGTDASPITTECGTDQPNIAAINNGTTADATNQIQLDWALTNTQLAPFASGAKRADSCLLVELSSATSPGLTFTNRSVRKNVIFTQASTFAHEADVTIKGLGAIPGGRDVYIWVQTLNMPAKVDPERYPVRIPIRPEGCGDPPPRRTQDAAADAKVGRAVVGQPPPQQSVAITDAAELTRLAVAGQLCHADLDAAMPTYRIHVYHDTGERVTIGGTQRPILRAQGAFGYRLAHNGPLTGWRHDLEAQGFTLQELAPNFYRIEKVPTDGVVPIKTRIQSLGGPRGFRFFVDLGFNIPQGNLGNSADGRMSFNAGLEGFVSANTSIEGILGYHAFDASSGSDPGSWQFSANLKQYFGPGPARAFVNAGAGLYRLDPGNTTEGGFNVGGGVLYEVTPRWAIEGVYNFHTVNTPGDATQFSTVQGGIRIQF